MTHLIDFQVTLPSNASMTVYPANKPQLYRTELPQPLNLEGKWEVALIDIQYPYKWKNIIADTELTFFLSPGLRPSDVDEIAAQKAVISDVMEQESKRGEEEVQSVPGEQARHTITITIPAGYYDGVQAILTKIASSFNFEAKKVTNKTESIRLVYNEIRDSIKYISYVPYWNIQIRFDQNSEIAKILSMDGYSRGKGFLTTMTLPSESTRPPYFERTSAVFIYSDIVQHQIVGDSLVQLIGVAPVLGTVNTQYYWAFNPIMYRPLCKSYIKDIEIQLCGSDGKLIPIIRGNSIVRLHFRKCRNTI